jgi:hypothetical protein
VLALVHVLHVDRHVSDQTALNSVFLTLWLAVWLLGIGSLRHWPHDDHNGADM